MHFFIFLNKTVHVGKVKLGIYAVGIHIHGKGDNIDVAGSFSVSEEGAFHSVGAGKKSKLGVGHACSAVVVGVKRKGDEFAVFKIFAHISLPGRHKREAYSFPPSPGDLL